LHFFVYYRYIERRQYPSCLLVDNSKRYCLKLVWKLFGPFLPFSYFPFCNKSSPSKKHGRCPLETNYPHVSSLWGKHGFI
jgi:hypothetical protein